MRVLATSVVRESLRGKRRSGFIYDIDWDSGRVEHSLAVPEPQFPESDDNPRGGVRGGRGVAVTDAGIVVANYDTLHVYDESWNPVDVLSHELFVGLHEIDWDGSHVWATATAIDAVLRVGLDGTVTVGWDPHEQHRRFGLRPRPHALDGSVDYRRRGAPKIDQCHVNGVAQLNGTTVVNCGLVRTRPSLPTRAWRRTRRRLHLGQPRENGRRNSGSSMVVALDGTPEAASVLLKLRDHDFPTHNGQLLAEGRVAVNDTTENTLRVYSLANGAPTETLAVKVPGTWLRGLEPVTADHVLVGSAPAQVMLVDVTTGAIEASVRLSDDPHEAVHGLTLYR
jgi:hypothetical protein